ncbi:uncharacterized protein LOC113582208 [Electrophorus electricus]|uniref:uncharacterized protein LOC113582208 n=1 Tax=Electrophorus electricus TaxID=8005 RepID=UPI0015D0BBFE|nr:uncharacterized protein LOC113582208 [Electrophorus electricus]
MGAAEETQHRPPEDGSRPAVDSHTWTCTGRVPPHHTPSGTHLGEERAEQQAEPRIPTGGPAAGEHVPGSASGTPLTCAVPANNREQLWNNKQRVTNARSLPSLTPVVPTPPLPSVQARDAQHPFANRKAQPTTLKSFKARFRPSRWSETPEDRQRKTERRGQNGEKVGQTPARRPPLLLLDDKGVTHSFQCWIRRPRATWPTYTGPSAPVPPSFAHGGQGQ